SPVIFPPTAGLPLMAKCRETEKCPTPVQWCGALLVEAGLALWRSENRDECIVSYVVRIFVGEDGRLSDQFCHASRVLGVTILPISITVQITGDSDHLLSLVEANDVVRRLVAHGIDPFLLASRCSSLYQTHLT